MDITKIQVMSNVKIAVLFNAQDQLNKKGERFVGFNPAVSNKAVKAIRETIRSWNLTRPTRETIEDFARMYNPVIRDWINYNGSFLNPHCIERFGILTGCCQGGQDGNINVYAQVKDEHNTG